jgi:hypothetical protein
LLAACLLLLVVGGNTGHAQADQRCFAGSDFCISGRIREFWEQNGGLPVFGLPISPVSVEINRNTGTSYFVQWFERHRLELYPNNPPPQDVRLGRLGAELLGQQDIPLQASTPQPGCQWFAETSHNVCNQAAGEGFLAYWQSHGLQSAAPDSYGQSLALFGLPLSEAYETTSDTGQRIRVQWFERARFEWHPANPPGSRVLLGRLGAEFQQGDIAIDQPAAAGPSMVWQGQTSQLYRVVLTIQNDAVQAVLITVDIQGERADAVGETPPERDNDLPVACSTPVLYINSAFDAAGLAPIRDNSFSLTLEDEDTVFYMNGTFETPNLLSGVAQLRTKPARRYVCLGSGSATWQAAPEGAGPPGSDTGPAPPPPGATRGRAPAPPDQPPPPPSEPAPPQLPTTSTAECPATPDPAAATDDPLRIVDVDKKIEIVTLQNVSNAQIDLVGWKICSVTGNQLHASLQGIMEAGETRGFVAPGAAIWSNDEPDDGALYDPLGNLVSYWDDPAN